VEKIIPNAKKTSAKIYGTRCLDSQYLKTRADLRAYPLPRHGVVSFDQSLLYFWDKIN